MMGKVRQINLLWQHFGSRWLLYRLRYAVSLRTGALKRRTPISNWNQQPLSKHLAEDLRDADAYFDYRRTRAPRFFFTRDDFTRFGNYFSQWDTPDDNPQKFADDILKGTLRYFSRTPQQIGFPPAWHFNPFTKQQTPIDLHWSKISDFEYGDIKLIWEASRFHFVFDLVRAYWRTSDERYAEAFWQFVESWRLSNPPQQGANWKCGQETSLRVLAWCFGLYGFLDANATNAERVTHLVEMIAVSGERIAANIEYALSQRNNHGISEGVGLWTIGVLFPELRAADAWRECGREVLEVCGRELIYDDGSFSQHSLNYQRLMLHDYLWALRLGDLHDQSFSSELTARVAQSAKFLYQVQDAETGFVPCYGQNDGALILPLNNCDYRDYRPVINAVHYLADGTHPYERGRWDEDLLWLFGEEAIAAPFEKIARCDLKADDGGYYTLRAKESWAFMRAATFRDRPAQADLLHVDLWWRGQNIATDAGTYSYNAPAPWDNSLSGTTYHNTITIDNLDQMNRAGKFLWLPWGRGSLRQQKNSPQGDIGYLEGEHDGYERLRPPAKHRRALVRLGEETWLILDAVQSDAAREYSLHWLLSDMPYEWDANVNRVTLKTPKGYYYLQANGTVMKGAEKINCASTLVRADEQSPRGWQSPYYHQRLPALSFKMTMCSFSVLMWSVFAPEMCEVKMNAQDEMEIKTSSWHSTIKLNEFQSAKQSLVQSIVIAGDLQDELRIF